MNYARVHIIYILLWLCSLTATAQTLEARLDSAAIRIGSQTRLTLTVRGVRAAAVTFPAVEPRQELAPGLEVISLKTDTTGEAVTRTITLTSWEEGRRQVPPMSVQAAGRTLRSRAIPLTVSTVAVDTTANAQPRPPHTVADNPFSWDDWSAPFWQTLAAALLLALVYWFALRLAQNKPIVSRIRFVRRLLPHQKALQEIERLKAQPHQGSEAQREYYTRLTDTLRLYLDERFSIRAREMTTTAIVARLEEQDPARTDELREVFQAADLVKFARSAADEPEDSRYLATVAAYIDDTKQENQPTVERVGQEAATGRRQARERLGAILLTAALAVVALALLIAAAVEVMQI